MNIKEITDYDNKSLHMYQNILNSHEMLSSFLSLAYSYVVCTPIFQN